MKNDRLVPERVVGRQALARVTLVNPNLERQTKMHAILGGLCFVLYAVGLRLAIAFYAQSAHHGPDRRGDYGSDAIAVVLTACLAFGLVMTAQSLAIIHERGFFSLEAASLAGSMIVAAGVLLFGPGRREPLDRAPVTVLHPPERPDDPSRRPPAAPQPKRFSKAA